MIGEILKTAMVFLLFNIAVFIECSVVVLANHRVPSRDQQPPLVDIFLDNVPYIQWCGDVSEYIILLMTSTSAILVIFHKYR